MRGAAPTVPLQALAALVHGMVSKLDIDEAIDSILRTANETLESQGIDLVLREASTGLWRLAAQYGKPVDACGRLYPIVTYGPWLEAIERGETVVANDFGAWLRGDEVAMSWVEEQADQHYWLNASIAAAPLEREGEVVGFLSATVCDRTLTSWDADFLTLLAQIASVGLANAELYAAAKRSESELERRVEERTRSLAEVNERLQRANRELGRTTEELGCAYEAAFRVLENERYRLARVLHDETCQLIAGAQLQMQTARTNVERGRSEAALENVDAARLIVAGIDEQTRAAMAEAYPALLNERGLVAAVGALDALRLERPRCTLEVQGTPGRLEPHEELTVFRIVQESLANACNHAQASQVLVRLLFGSTTLRVEVRDDGVGFDPAAVPMDTRTHLGIMAMRDRAQSIGRSLHIESHPGRGTLVWTEADLLAR